MRFIKNSWHGFAVQDLKSSANRQWWSYNIRWGTQRFFREGGRFPLKSGINHSCFYQINCVYFYDILHLILLRMIYNLVWHILTNGHGKQSFLITAWRVTVTLRLHLSQRRKTANLSNVVYHPSFRYIQCNNSDPIRGIRCASNEQARKVFGKLKTSQVNGTFGKFLYRKQNYLNKSLACWF